MVVDYPTGIALFHHTWSWKGDPNVPGIAKVIVALYKLSQSLGGRGDTNYVLFDPPPEGRRRSQQDLYSIKSKRASGGAGLRPMIASPRPRKPRIRCVFSKLDHVVVGLFHEIGDKLELPRQCGDAILREFVAQYGEKLASMRHIFEDMIDEKKVRDCAMTQEQVLETFTDFDNNLHLIDEVAEFNRVRSAKESSSAGTYTFSFSLTDDTVELIKRERQKQREEESERERGDGGETPARQRSSLASSSGPSSLASASEPDSEDSTRADDDSTREDDCTSTTPLADATAGTNRGAAADKESSTKKRERKNSKEKKESRATGKKEPRGKDKEDRDKDKDKKKKKKKDKKDKARTERDVKKSKERELVKMVASV
jgi:hypothetical protein